MGRYDLMEAVWGSRSPTASNVVDIVVRSLRRKRGADAECVETVRGTGCRYRVPQRHRTVQSQVALAELTTAGAQGSAEAHVAGQGLCSSRSCDFLMTPAPMSALIRWNPPAMVSAMVSALSFIRPESTWPAYDSDPEVL